MAIAGPFTTDPMRLFAGLAVAAQPSWLPGYGTIDPNMGYTAYALGRHAVQDWFSGTLPLWNPYEGLGQPLLGEMQSAALFPPTLLLLLPHGQVWEHALLQAVAGFGTYALLRRLGLARGAAIVGGVLFELNGAFAWLRNAIYNPIAFLPWLLYAVETLAQAAREGAPWRARLPIVALGAVAGALALYAGFPESVYFYSLLIALWAMLRLALLPGRRLRFVADLAGVGGWALLMALPVLLAFVQFLPEAEVGGHKDGLFSTAFLPPQALLTVFLPYAYGPIFAAPVAKVQAVFGGFGGYWGVATALLAIGGAFVGRDRAITWLAAGWLVFALAVSHGVPGVHDAFMRLPLTAIAAYCRYLNASWLLCGAILAAIFLDRVGTLPAAARRRAGWFAVAVLTVWLGGAAALAWPTLGEVWRSDGGWGVYALGASVVASVLVVGFLLALRSRRAMGALAALAIVEAFAAFLLPLASNPIVRAIDRPLVGFLRRSVGLQRVAAVAGNALAPNFGSVFGIATVNYDDLPVPARTVSYVAAHLDPHASAVIFAPRAGPVRTPAEVVAHLPGYRAAAVRYLLAPPGFFPAGVPDGPVERFRGTVAAVFELPGAAPFASAPGCRVVAETRERIRAQCDAPSRLVRRELFMRGWVARVNGRPASVGVAEEAFQAVELPAGESRVTFRYAPDGVRPACWVALVAALGAAVALRRGGAPA